MRVNLSDSEWKLMNRLWEQSPRTIMDLTASFPAVDREDAAAAETESFLSRVYGGSLGLMVSNLVESHQLTAADIAELSAILEKAGGEEHA